MIERLNRMVVDSDKKPYENVRIRHTSILDDPFDDPKGLVEPPSPEARRERVGLAAERKPR